jgi:hypothetical protein
MIITKYHDGDEGFLDDTLDMMHILDDLIRPSHVKVLSTLMCCGSSMYRFQ